MRVHCRDYLKLKCFNNSIKRFVESNNEVRMESSFRQQLNLSLSIYFEHKHTSSPFIKSITYGFQINDIAHVMSEWVYGHSERQIPMIKFQSIIESVSVPN